MPAKTDKDRKREQRLALRSAGFRPHEVWVFPADWPKVKSLVEKLKREREK
jgi:hypothetical protein